MAPNNDNKFEYIFMRRGRSECKVEGRVEKIQVVGDKVKRDGDFFDIFNKLHYVDITVTSYTLRLQILLSLFE